LRLMSRTSMGAGTLTSPATRPRISVRGDSRWSGLIGGHYTMPRLGMMGPVPGWATP
jgi:hypothetical protein